MNEFEKIAKELKRIADALERIAPEKKEKFEPTPTIPPGFYDESEEMKNNKERAALYNAMKGYGDK